MDLFQDNGHTLVTKKGCTWSKKARHLLKKHNINFMEIQVCQNDASKNSWGYKKIKMTFKHETFPILFDKTGKKMGGYDDMKSMFK